MRNGQLLFLAKGRAPASVPQNYSIAFPLRKGREASKLLPGPTVPFLNQGRESYRSPQSIYRTVNTPPPERWWLQMTA
jgi:hypothetical protein